MPYHFIHLFTIIRIITSGIYTAVAHLVFGVTLTLTIIGIPFARQHFKLAALTLSPFDKNIISEWDIFHKTITKNKAHFKSNTKKEPTFAPTFLMK